MTNEYPGWLARFVWPIWCGMAVILNRKIKTNMGHGRTLLGAPLTFTMVMAELFLVFR